MLFRLENRKTGRGTHTGVLEFIAEEGMLYVPYWVSAFPPPISHPACPRTCFNAQAR